jgi:DNA-binding NarL/FixJ family response regulator
MRVVIVDDHRLILVGLRQLLEAYDDVEIVAAAEDGAAAVLAAREHHPDVVLMDLKMRGLDGLHATREIKASVPGCAVVVLSTSDAFEDVTAALEAGADGYLLKESDPDRIVDGLRSCLEGGMPLSPSVAAQLMRRPARAPVPATVDLTRREFDILHQLREGRTNLEIADALQISEKTVKSHCSSLFQAIGVTSRMQAALWATRHLDDALSRSEARSSGRRRTAGSTGEPG